MYAPYATFFHSYILFFEAFSASAPSLKSSSSTASGHLLAAALFLSVSFFFHSRIWMHINSLIAYMHQHLHSSVYCTSTVLLIYVGPTCPALFLYLPWGSHHMLVAATFDKDALDLSPVPVCQMMVPGMIDLRQG